MWRATLGLATAALLAAVAGCKIVEHGDQADGGDAGGQTGRAGGTDADGFDPVRYVDARWKAELAPFAETQAADLAEVLAALADDREAAGSSYGHREGEEGKPWSYFVVARGTPLAIDRSSRAGVMPFDLAPEDGTADVLVQIGPVIRGTALRDALPFMSFADVVNQMEWAAISRQMHERLNAEVLGTIDLDALVGRQVLVRGAFTDPGPGAEVAVTPLSITPTDD